MQDLTIGFIGGGNMARALVGGLIAAGVPARNVWVSDPVEEQRATLAAQYNIHTTTDNTAVADQSDVLVLAVKPQQMRAAATAIALAVARRRPLVVSIAAGIRMDDLARWLDTPQLAIVRAMPNTPALVQSGASGLCANAWTDDEGRTIAEHILRAVGLVQWVPEESMMDAVTALSGSGPAYFLLVMEALHQAGVAMGLPSEQARLLTLQTAFGTARLALESEADAAELRRRVTSPGGTTEQAIKVLQEGQLEALFERALLAAQKRGASLAAQYGEG
ncbi:MAG: pyrroline-5-carboxylate reductase [Gammaproteobacteria bacterium]|nr:pyrroline-5-carboxylate reductase [Gammaproteobacteria bacterium]